MGVVLFVLTLLVLAALPVTLTAVAIRPSALTVRAAVVTLVALPALVGIIIAAGPIL